MLSDQNAAAVKQQHRWHNHELMYCANVHPCSDVASLIQQIKQHAVAIKRARNLDKMQLGLWFNEQLLQDFADNSLLTTQFFSLLASEQLTIKTLNGFPQQQFHAPRVKTNVYRPSWDQEQRLLYTTNLVDFVAKNKDSFAKNLSISTLPLGYKSHWNSDKQQRALRQIKRMAQYLAMINDKFDVNIRLCFEMEPDCVLETSDEMVTLFTRDFAAELNAAEMAHLGVCFDICHQAVMHEDIGAQFAKFSLHNIIIGKIQVSNALRFELNQLSHITPSLARYFSSPYLHQIKVNTNKEVLSFSDLSNDSLRSLPTSGEARIHFHLPINQTEISETLGTTQHDIINTLSALDMLQHKPDLEVETYTWHIIDDAASDEQLNQYLVNELDWLQHQLIKLQRLQA